MGCQSNATTFGLLISCHHHLNQGVVSTSRFSPFAATLVCMDTPTTHIWSSRCDCATLAQFVQCYMIVALTYDAVVDHSLRSLLAVTEHTSHALCTDSASSQQDYNQVSFISNWARTRCCIHCSA